MPQDLPVGREVMRVSATDIDDGDNSIVRYSLSSKRTDDSDYFRIDEATGVIFLLKPIDVSKIEKNDVKKVVHNSTFFRNSNDTCNGFCFFVSLY